VMYLTRPQIEATLSVVERRSSVGSRLVVMYHRPAAFLVVLGLWVGRLGEPLRSAFSPEQMRALLAQYRFTVRRDDDIPTLGRAFGGEIASASRPLGHAR